MKAPHRFAPAICPPVLPAAGSPLARAPVRPSHAFQLPGRPSSPLQRSSNLPAAGQTALQYTSPQCFYKCFRSLALLQSP
jgi:hypothetical protein